MSNDSEIALAAAQSAAASAAAAATALDTMVGGGGSSSLTVVNGGTVDLDNTQDDGYLIGYRVTATTTIEGVSFPVGAYIFERDSSVYGGWTYRTLDAGTTVVPPPDSTAPTAPTLSVNNTSQTQLVATFSGGTDAVGVTQYRTRIDGGSWSSAASPRTFSGLAVGSAHTIDAQAGDASNNWSASTSWSGSTASPAWSPADLPGQLARYTVQDPAGYVESGGVISQMTDMTGAGKHMVQATAGARPSLVAASLNGHPVAQFLSDDIVSSAAASFSDTGSFTLWAVLRKDATPAGLWAFLRATTTGDYVAGYGFTNSHESGVLFTPDYGDSAIGHTVTVGHADVLAVAIEGGAQPQRVGNTIETKTSADLSRPITSFAVGGLAVSVAECGVLSGLMSADDWTALHDYAIARYGVH